MQAFNGLSYNTYGVLNLENGFYYNPAGINAVKNHAVSFLYQNRGGELKNIDFGYGHRLFNQRYIIAGNIDYTTSEDYEILDGSGNKTGTFQYQYVEADIIIGSTAYFISTLKDLHYGVKIKIQNEKADTYSSSAYMADLGFLYKFYFEKNRYCDEIGIYASFENLGKSLSGQSYLRFSGGAVFCFPVVKQLRQIFLGMGIIQYLDSQMEANNAQVFTIGLKENLSSLSQSLKYYSFLLSLSYNYIDAVNVLGDLSGLEYGFKLDGPYFGIGYSCLFSRLTGNKYRTSLSIKF